MKFLCAVLSCASAVHAVGVGTCCTRLHQELGTKVSFLGQPAYDATESSYWSLQEAGLKPGCILRPSVPQDVSRAVAIIAPVDGCNFAIKGQGHAPAAGFANIDGGVTIDMTGLSTTLLSPDHSVLSVGAGASWLQVYQYLNPFNVSVAGGRNGLVGVGGLTLGGGISHFSPRVGWACDTVVNFEVVLADGTLTNANKSCHSGLYRALKGGANNLGVVTRFDLRTFSQGNLSVSSFVNTISQRGPVLRAFTDIVSSPKFDVYTSLVVGFLYNSSSKAWVISNSAVYTSPVLDPPVFAELAAVPSISNSSRITSLASLADEAPTPPLNWLFATATFKASAEFMLEIFDILNNTLYSFNPQGGVVWDVAFEPLPSMMLSHAAKTGGNVLGVRPEQGNSYIMLLSALWPDSVSNAVVEQVSRQAISTIESRAKAEGLLRKFQYLNYAAPYQTPLASYGADSVKFLQRVSRKYDPLALFQARVPGGFKLAKEGQL
ncbi:FAD-binding domain-containing protein [Parachaetomium inaequale]|uniref:FAD-binding domain-containing protein n=1 Tax=Parachaetomium inaequale TaxID=2588326 RepID=A0AAN6P5Y7_9PEZI|nr:FAD-binding domain-containing protein [Parachaetomium inaequale]